MDGFITVENDSIAEYSEKRSRFIAILHPCETENEANEFIEKIRSENRNARHNVFAYSIYDNSVTRFSDDGEPHGTAGKPVLDVLVGNGITNAVIVVTRYFGGVLLGTGGLVRAYSRAASDAVLNANKVKMIPCSVFQTKLEYCDHGKLLNLIANMNGVITDTVFESNIKITYYIENDRVNEFLKKFSETFFERLHADKTGKCIHASK